MIARRITYEFATTNGIRVPHTRLRDSSAGGEWLIGFQKLQDRSEKSLQF